jgi:hypothetical protein
MLNDIKLIDPLLEVALCVRMHTPRATELKEESHQQGRFLGGGLVMHSFSPSLLLYSTVNEPADTTTNSLVTAGQKILPDFSSQLTRGGHWKD